MKTRDQMVWTTISREKVSLPMTKDNQAILKNGGVLNEKVEVDLANLMTEMIQMMMIWTVEK